jgi:hypothetical protein
MGDFPAKNTVYTPYMYGPGQPYMFDEHPAKDTVRTLY